jgi:hypothetical protein
LFFMQAAPSLLTRKALWPCGKECQYLQPHLARGGSKVNLPSSMLRARSLNRSARIAAYKRDSRAVKAPAAL